MASNSMPGNVKRSRSDTCSSASDSLFVGQQASKKIATETNGISSTIIPAQEHDETSKGTTASHNSESTSSTTKSAQEHEVFSQATIDSSSEADSPALDKNGRVPGYDASKKSLPTCAPYCPSFAVAEEIVRQCLRYRHRRLHRGHAGRILQWSNRERLRAFRIGRMPNSL